MDIKDRPTPETDKQYGSSKGQRRGIVYDVDHARRLEQQRDAWRDVAVELAKALANRFHNDFCGCLMCADRKTALRHYDEAKKQKEMMG